VFSKWRPIFGLAVGDSPDSHSSTEASGTLHSLCWASSICAGASLAFFAFAAPLISPLQTRCRFSMPRHKRQRPLWLPAWVPFKDGRYLGLARQTLLAWSSTVLAIFFFCMTVTFAFGSSRLTQARPIYSSQSNLILILRIFSEAAGLFLAGTVHSTFEICQWILISRPEGIRLPQFLALQSSTGPLGLVAIALGRGLPPNEWPVSPRLTSLIRLMAEVAVPLLGVLIMSELCSARIFCHQHVTS
jgi:hypothetical protein